MASGTRPITLLQAVNSNDVASVSKILAEKKIQINFTDNHNFCGMAPKQIIIYSFKYKNFHFQLSITPYAKET